MPKKTFVLSVVFSLISFLGGTLNASNTEMLVMKKQDNGKQFTIKAGALIQVELEQTGATGALWQIDSLDEGLLSLKQTFTKGGVVEKSTGTPVTRHWIIKARKKGTTDLELLYHRPWKGKDQSMDRFVVKLTIE